MGVTDIEAGGMRTFTCASECFGLKVVEEADKDGVKGGQCGQTSPHASTASVASSLSVWEGSSCRSFAFTSDSSQLSHDGGADRSGTAEDTELESTSWTSDEDTESYSTTSESSTMGSQEGGGGGGDAPGAGAGRCDARSSERRRARQWRIRTLVAKIEPSIQAAPHKFSMDALERGLPASVVLDRKFRVKLLGRLRAILQDAKTSPSGCTGSSSFKTGPGVEPPTRSTSSSIAGETTPRPTKMSL